MGVRIIINEYATFLSALMFVTVILMNVSSFEKETVGHAELPFKKYITTSPLSSGSFLFRDIVTEVAVEKSLFISKAIEIY